MADIKITTANQSGFIPSFWANRALDVLRNQIVLANLVARDVNFAQAGWKGQTITVPYPGSFTAQDKSADTPIAPQTPTGGQSVSLTLNKHKVVPFLIEDFANAQANMDLMDRYIQPAVIALAEQFETDLWATAMGVNGAPLQGVAGTDITSAVVRKTMKGLNDQKAPQADRQLVVSTKDQIALLGDSTLSTYFAFSQADSIRNGYVGKLYGMDTYWSQLAPSSTYATVGTATAGTFTLTVGGQTTSVLNYNAPPAQVQAALQALSTVGAGLAIVGGTAGSYNIVLTGAAAGQVVSGVAVAALTGGAFSAVAGQSNIAFHKNAVMFATRPFAPTPGDAGVHSAQSNDPESGLSIRISAQYDINNMGMRCNLDLLYGMTVLRPTQAVIVNS